VYFLKSILKQLVFDTILTAGHTFYSRVLQPIACVRKAADEVRSMTFSKPSEQKYKINELVATSNKLTNNFSTRLQAD
jgi:hypothetical protein